MIHGCISPNAAVLEGHLADASMRALLFAGFTQPAATGHAKPLGQLGTELLAERKTAQRETQHEPCTRRGTRLDQNATRSLREA